MRRRRRGTASALSEPVLAVDARIALEPRSPRLPQIAAPDKENGVTEAEYVVASSEIRHVEGYCWSAQVGATFGMGDWAGEKLRSPLRLRRAVG